jgi:hypothetical protein
MILDNSLYGNFYGNPFVIGTTNRNEYYPVYAVSDELIEQVYHYRGERLSEPIIDGILLYKKPINNAKRKYGGLNKYADLFTCLSQSAKSDVFEFTINDESHYLNCSKGYMSDIDDNILLVLCSNSPQLFNHRGELITKNLRLYVSNRLVNNEVYKNIFKKIDSEYIHFCYENDIDVIFTTPEKIQKQVFNNDFKVEFDNLTELHEHLNSGIGNNLFFDEPVEEDLPF